MPIPDQPTAWHTAHQLHVITEPNKPNQIIVQIKETNTNYPIIEIDKLIQVLQRIKQQT